MGAVGPPAAEKEPQGSLALGGAFGSQSQGAPGLQSGPAAAVPTVPTAVTLPSGASSSWSRLSCRGELPRDWRSGGEARPDGPAADSGVAGVAPRDTGGPCSARGQVLGCLGGEVRPGDSGCEVGVMWLGKKAVGRFGITGGKG